MDALLRESVVNGKTVNIGRHFVRIVFCFFESVLLLLFKGGLHF